MPWNPRPSRRTCSTTPLWRWQTCPLAEVRDGQEAVRLAQRACRKTEYHAAEYVDTLAAAYAEAGRFPDAIRTAQQALRMAEFARQADLASQIGGKIQLYQAGKAFHLPQGAAVVYY